MRAPGLWVPACVMTLGLAGTASATTYYVAPTGNDAGSGSSTSPWQTLRHAVETIAPGDVILVRSGTYAGCRIRNSGTPAAAKTLARDVVTARAATRSTTTRSCRPSTAAGASTSRARATRTTRPATW